LLGIHWPLPAFVPSPTDGLLGRVSETCVGGAGQRSQPHVERSLPNAAKSDGRREVRIPKWHPGIGSDLLFALTTEFLALAGGPDAKI